MNSEDNALPDAKTSFIIIYEGKCERKLDTESIEQLGALRYTVEEIAMYFDIDKKYIQIVLDDKDSEFSYYFRRGQLIYAAREQMNLLTSASGGNTTAGERLDKIHRDKNFEISKLDIFGAIDKRDTFLKLQDFLTGGASAELSNNEALYLETLRLIDSFSRNYGSRNTLKLLQKKPFELSYARARSLMDEATNLFYADKNINRKALRNKYAEMLEEMAITCRRIAKSSKDFEVAGNLTVQAAKLRGLDKEDVQPLERDTYRKQVLVLTLEPKQVGLGDTDRNQLAAQIDALPLPEMNKRRFRYDTLIEDVPFKEYLNEQPQKD
ncbi:MAG: hypothetical protein LBN27_12290 [Prevotellaceae bacterium]|jgi:hypothetical protein|nr:hypothetical protein [Prevotellaceae bacterium]